MAFPSKEPQPLPEISVWLPLSEERIRVGSLKEASEQFRKAVEDWSLSPSDGAWRPQDGDVHVGSGKAAKKWAKICYNGSALDLSGLPMPLSTLPPA